MPKLFADSKNDNDLANLKKLVIPLPVKYFLTIVIIGIAFYFSAFKNNIYPACLIGLLPSILGNSKDDYPIWVWVSTIIFIFAIVAYVVWYLLFSGKV